LNPADANERQFPVAKGPAPASIPARIAAASPKTIDQNLQTAAADAVAPKPQLLPDSQTFYKQFAAGAERSDNQYEKRPQQAQHK
jgi:hypothetical protein